MNAEAPIVPANLSGLSDKELRRLENRIARKYSGKVPWIAVVWAFGNLAVWLSLWPLVFSGLLPLWAAFPVATVNMALVYLPTHEAQHDIIARPGTKLRWLNELVGHATSWMLVFPFQVLRVTHLDHHRHTNDPELDVDITTKAEGPWQAIWASIRNRQPDAKRNHDYAASLVRNGRPGLIMLSLAYKLGFIGILGTLAWNGYALDALFLWWLPYQIAITYILFFLSWAPHHPGKETGRYTNTRSWKSKVGNIGSMGMQFHIVHHLHPYIPLHLTPAAYREMRPILEARGCRLGDN
ncbi:fatty acid desaturase [Erythrobacter sp. THAF29]|uniref:fatty acid desaturase n=1 Tax=Erythrobacter sp. THAF29 TaxID=2587851 RepID=UPI001267A4E6|nr:fatty acid desaturase [Erythrobacter sp. THAF29]QFT78917.1 Fatty acid desaturase [Erythrobacter sp. THAF29]